MQIEIDLVDVLEATDSARRELRSVPTELHRIGARAAKSSRDHHIYKNRTGRAEANTQAYSERAEDAAYTLVTINVPYGSYLMKGGTTRRHESLTALEDAIKEAETELEYFAEGLEANLDR